MLYIVDSEGVVKGVIEDSRGTLTVTSTDRTLNDLLETLNERGLQRTDFRHEDGRLVAVTRTIPLPSATVDDLAVALLPRGFYIATEKEVELKRVLEDVTRDGKLPPSTYLATRGYVLHRRRGFLKPVGWWFSSPSGIRVFTRDRELARQIRALKHEGVKTLSITERGEFTRTIPYKEASFLDINENLRDYVLVPAWGVEK